MAEWIGRWVELTFFQFFPIALLLVVAGWFYLWRWYRPLFTPLLLFYGGCVALALVYETQNTSSWLIAAHSTIALLAAVGLLHGVTSLEHALVRPAFQHWWESQREC